MFVTLNISKILSIRKQKAEMRKTQPYSKTLSNHYKRLRGSIKKGHYLYIGKELYVVSYNFIIKVSTKNKICIQSFIKDQSYNTKFKKYIYITTF